MIKPPSDLHSLYDVDEILFLGGSIEQGTARDWQRELHKLLLPKHGVILNPRRDDWDSSWDQDPTPGTPFHSQVTWELEGQDMSDIIVYYFDGNTKSPITLLELGAYGSENPHLFRKKVMVYCPKTFWRYGNVKIFCEKHKIECFEHEGMFKEKLYEAIP